MSVTKKQDVNQEDDELMMIEVKNGNLDSLVPLFDKYNVKLFNFFLHMGSKRDVAEDLTQNVFSRIIAYKHTYNENFKFRTWMYQLARNVQIDHYHKNKLMISEYKEVEEVGGTAADAIYESEKKDRFDILKDAIELLSIEDREIIELSKFQDLKYEDISKITGNSVGAIKVRVHRAVNKLREIYFQIA